MKLALMFAGMAAGRRAGGPGELLKGGTKLLSSSPELARLTDEVRGRLMEAGKSAALAVATRQVESLTDRVGRRVESLGDLGTQRRSSSEEAPPEQDEDEYAEEPAEAEEAEEADDTAAEEAPAEPERPARARNGRSRSTSATGARRTSGAGRTASRTAGKAASKTTSKAAGKATDGRRSPRTRRAGSDG
jgi:hypothetical protein